jgi:hypothetical protein
MLKFIFTVIAIVQKTNYEAGYLFASATRAGKSRGYGLFSHFHFKVFKIGAAIGKRVNVRQAFNSFVFAHFFVF